MTFHAFVYPSQKLASLSPEEFEAVAGHDVVRHIIRPIPTEERPMREILYIHPESIPLGVVTSTARKGDKWSHQANVGDTLRVLKVGSNEVWGYVAVVAKEFVTYNDVLKNADHNHCGFNVSKAAARSHLWDELAEAYGSLDLDEPFTILHLLPIPQVNEQVNALFAASKEVVEEALAEATEAVKQARGIAADHCNRAEQVYDAAMATVAHCGEFVTATNERAISLQEQLDAALEPDEVEARDRVDQIVNVAAGAIAAHEQNNQVSAIEVVDTVGDIETAYRIEF